MKTDRLIVRLALLIAMMATAFRASAEGKQRVGVLSWNRAEPRYEIALTAIKEQAEKAGLTSDKVEFQVEDAKGDKKLVGDLIKKLQQAHVDIWVALGTSAAVPVSKAVTDKPVVISSVFDPVQSKIIADWANSGNNVTGSSTFVSIPAFLRRLMLRSKGTWTINTIGVVYTPGETNSELQWQAVKSGEQELGVKVVGLPVTKPEDVKALAAGLKSKADLLYVTGSNVVGTNLAVIIGASIKQQVLTTTHLDDLVDRGVLIGLAAAPEEIGVDAGIALVKVLKGASPSSIPVVYPIPKLLINRKTAEAGKFTIPPALDAWAKSAEKL